MAITTTTRLATFAGDGVTTVFPFAFKVFLPTDLYLVTVDQSGNLVLLALGTDYSVKLRSRRRCLRHQRHRTIRPKVKKLVAGDSSHGCRFPYSLLLDGARRSVSVV